MSNQNTANTVTLSLVPGGFLGATFLVLLVLKIIGYGTYSWWIVFLPLAVPFIALTAFCAVALFIYVICVLAVLGNDGIKAYRRKARKARSLKKKA